MKLFTITLCFLVLMSALIFPVQAQESDDFLKWFAESNLNPDVTIGGKKASLLDVTSTVYVIDKEMIENYNFMTISEALNSVANFMVTRTYLKKNIPTSRGLLQDHYATRVLILINNIPTYSAVTGEGNLDRVNINDVERIEVLRGTGSYTYGNNAFSGAVNIILKNTAEDYKGGMHAASGDDNALMGGANYLFNAGENKTIFAAANFSNEDGQQYSFTDELGTTGYINEYVDSTNVTLTGTIGNHTILYNGYQVEESYLGVTPRWTAGAGNDHDLNGQLGSYIYKKPWSEDSSTKLTLFYDLNVNDLSRTTDDNTRSNIEGFRYGAMLDQLLKISDTVSLQFGASYDFRKSVEYTNYNVTIDSVLENNNMKNKEADEYSVFGQINLSLSPFSVLVGAKFTDAEFGGQNVSSRASFVYSINETNAIKLIAGQSFRSPTLFELYFRTSTNTVIGNEDLDAEESDCIELSYQTIQDYFIFQTTIYTATYKNNIYRALLTLDNGTQASTYVNGDDFEADGLEFEIAYRNPEVINVFLNLGYIDGDNGDQIEGSDHYNFKYVPELTGTAGIQKSFGNVSFSLVASYLDDMDASSDTVPGETIIDLNLGYNQEINNTKIMHAITVKNLTDEEQNFPEYVRRQGLNDVPLNVGTKIYYTVRMKY